MFLFHSKKIYWHKTFLFRLKSSVLIVENIFFIFLSGKKMCVISANIIVSKILDTYGRSFTYSSDINGPDMDRLETPNLIGNM